MLKLLAVSVLVLAGNAWSQVIFSDDFGGSVLDSSKWDVVTSPLTPAGTTGAVYVSGGYAVLVNRGTIITKSEFSSSIDLTGRFRIDSNYDVFSVFLRTTGSSTNPWKSQDNGIFINFQQDTYGDFSQRWIGISEWSVGGLLNPTAAYTNDQNVHSSLLNSASVWIPGNTWLDFRITDDGDNVSVYFGNLDNPIVSASSNLAPGSHIAFNNGYSDNQVSIDSITIVPEPSSLSLLLAGGLVALSRRRKS